MSEIRTNMIISGESSEYRSNMEISVVTLNNTMIDTHSSFRTNIDISTTLNDGNVNQIQTNLELNNISLQFYLVDMTKLNQSLLYFSKFFNMYFEPEVMWELLAQGTNEQINISHLSDALSKYTPLDTTLFLIKTIEDVGNDLSTHMKDDERHFTIDEKEFLLNIMNNGVIGNGGGLFEKVIINRDDTVVPAVRPIKQEGKDSGIISNTFISCKGTDITSANLESGAGLTRYDLFSILTSDPLNADEYINEKFLRLDRIAEEVLKGEKDPTVPAYVKSITREQIYSWDLVASLFSVSKDNTYILVNNNRGFVSDSFISCKGLDNSAFSSSSGLDIDLVWYYLGLDGTEQINKSHLTNALDGYATEDWVKTQGYLTSFIESDPTVPQYVKSISQEQITSWDLVASLFKVSQDDTYVYLTNNRGFVSNSFISCKGLDDSTSTSDVIDMNQIWFYLQQETSEQINKSHLLDALSEYATTNWILNQGYLKEFIEQDPTVASYIKNITQEQINNWDLASSFFGLSDDNTYIFTKDKRGFVSESFISCKGLDITSPGGSSLDMDLVWHYLQQDSLEQINISHIRDALYNYATKDWINSQGFLTNFTESDPTVPSYIKAITKEQIDNWNSTLSLFSLIDDIYVIVNNNKGFVSNSFISCRGVDDTSVSTGNIDMDLVWFYLQSDSNEQIHISHLRDALSNYADKDWIENQGYLKNFVETDPTVPEHVKRITADQINSWDIAASLFSISEDNSYLLVNYNRGIVSNSFLSCKGVDTTSSSTGSNIDMDLIWYFLSQEGNDQIHSSHLEDALKNYTTKDWVNAQGYLKSFIEKDPTVPSYVKTITQTQLDSWDLVASLFSLIEDSYVLVNNNRGFVVNSYISCKGIDNNASQIDSSFSREYLFNILSGNPEYGEYINIKFLDLSDYITVLELNNKGYITASALSNYAKLTDIPSLEGYATKSELTALGNQVLGLWSLDTDANAAKTTYNVVVGGELSCVGKTKIITEAHNSTYGFITTSAHTGTNNVSVMDFGVVYGFNAEVVAMSMYRDTVGIGRQYTYDELYANRKASISLDVANALKIGSTIISEASSQNTKYLKIDGDLVVTGAISFGGFGESGGSGGGITTVTKDMVISALGYTPYNAASFTKANIKSTLGISDWALASTKPIYTKSDVGLGNVTNLAASGYLTDLSSNATNAVSITVGGTTKNISVSTLKTSLGLGFLAYKSNLAFSELTNKPTTVNGYGITDAITTSNIGSQSVAYATNAGSLEGKTFNQWDGIAYNGGGVLEVGKYIDFHNSASSTADYDTRIVCGGVTGNKLTLPTASGTLALTSQFADYQPLSTAINTGNIGSQSVNYANSAGSATNATNAANAANADKLGNQAPSYYATAVSVTAVSNRLTPFETYITPGTTTTVNASLSVTGTMVVTSTATFSDRIAVGSVSSSYNVSGAVLASGPIASNYKIRANAIDNPINHGFLKAETYSSNRGVLHIGTNYGAAGVLNNDAADVVAISIYRGVIGVGRQFTGAELYSQYSASTKLLVDGNLVATGSITFGSASDRRLKDNIKSMTNEQAVAVLSALNPVTFNWNSTAYELGKLSGTSDGFIADEYEKLIPNSGRNIWDNYRAIDHTRVSGYLVKGWQNHETRLKKAEKRIEELENELKQYRRA